MMPIKNPRSGNSLGLHRAHQAEWLPDKSIVYQYTTHSQQIYMQK